MFKRLILLSVVPFFFASCASTDTRVRTEVSTGGASAAEIIGYTGPKARIAVGSFDVKAAKARGNLGSGMQEMLIDALFKTNRFIVLEREALRDIQSEYRLGESGWAADSPERGTFETADILLTGAITAFEPDYQRRGGGGVVVPLPSRIGGGLRIERKEAYIAASIRLVDIRTRRIIKTGTVEGYSSSSGLGILGGGLIGNVVLGAGYESYQNTPMEKAVMIMLENSISEIVGSVPSDYYRYTPEGKPAGEQAKAPSGLGIVGGQDIFTAGTSPVFIENFNRYDIGASPSGWETGVTQVEIASFDGKKWLRFLGSGTVSKEINTSGDFSVEAFLFIPDPKTELSVKYGDTNNISLKDGQVLVEGVPAGNINREENRMNLGISRKGQRTVLFVNGKRIFAAETASSRSNRLILSAENINTGEGREILVTDIKIAEYVYP